jgi:hypothetical protein
MNSFEDGPDHELSWLLKDEVWDECSPLVWWVRDHLEENPNGLALTNALIALVEGGCVPSDLLEELREVEGLSWPLENAIARRELPRTITRLRKLAKDLGRIEMSPLVYLLREKIPMGSKDLETYADVLEAARLQTRRTSLPTRAAKIHQLRKYVDKKIRERGAVGKRRADEALALLLSEVTGGKLTPAAQRVARSRMNRKEGKKRVAKPKRPAVRALRGSRAGPRKPKLVSFDKLGDEAVAVLQGPGRRLQSRESRREES